MNIWFYYTIGKRKLRTTVSLDGYYRGVSGRSQIANSYYQSHAIGRLPSAGAAAGPRPRYANWTSVLYDLLRYGLASYNRFSAWPSILRFGG